MLLRSSAILLAATFLAAGAGAGASTPDLASCDSWVLACHYTNASRESDYNINRVVIHKTEGGAAAGSASWFANCNSSASAHYNFDKSNGQCYQSVYEADIAWHAGYSSTNSNSIGIEHSGWTANNDTSTACYNESAVETRACVARYAVPANRSYIIGHSEVPGCSGYGGGVNCHTDPGKYWNWSYYMSQVTGGTLPTYTVDNSSSGFAASSNWTLASSATDKYGADYRYRPTDAVSDRASWTATVGTAGTYRVQAWWSAGTNRTDDAAYELPNGTVIHKNQQTSGGAWQTLGSVSLATGAQSTYVSVWTTTGYVVIADAVRYTP